MRARLVPPPLYQQQERHRRAHPPLQRHIPASFLDALDHPARRPSAPLSLSIRDTTVPLEPHKSLHNRLLALIVPSASFPAIPTSSSPAAALGSEGEVRRRTKTTTAVCRGSLRPLRGGAETGLRPIGYLDGFSRHIHGMHPVMSPADEPLLRCGAPLGTSRCGMG